MQNVKLLIAEDHTLVRYGLVNTLREFKWINVISEAETGEELIANYHDCKPDIVLTDIKMPKIDGLTAVDIILKKHKKAKVLFLSMFCSEQYAYEVYNIGGKGLLPKNITKEELIDAIKTVYNGGLYFSGYNAKDIKKLTKGDKFVNLISNSGFEEKLSKREIEILKLIGQGYSSEEIANSLFIGKRTVDSHRRSIMDKLNLQSAPKLIKFAVEHTPSISDKINNG